MLHGPGLHGELQVVNAGALHLDGQGGQQEYQGAIIMPVTLKVARNVIAVFLL